VSILRFCYDGTQELGAIINGAELRHIDDNATGGVARIMYLGSIGYSVERCYLSAMVYSAEQRVQKRY
jgi:hypothetical protein